MLTVILLIYFLMTPSNTGFRIVPFVTMQNFGVLSFSPLYILVISLHTKSITFSLSKGSPPKKTILLIESKLLLQKDIKLFAVSIVIRDLTAP